MGRFRQQPESALLRADRRRPEAAPAMRRLKGILHRLSGLFRRRTLESDMSEEMQAHLDALTERNRAAGMSSDEARYAALRTFGGVAQIAERARDERRSLWGEQ